MLVRGGGLQRFFLDAYLVLYVCRLLAYWKKNYQTVDGKPTYLFPSGIHLNLSHEMEVHLNCWDYAPFNSRTDVYNVYLNTKFEHNVTCCAVFVDFGILFHVSSWRQKLCGLKDQGSKMLKLILKFSKVLQCVETMSRSRILVCFDKDYSILCPYVLPPQFLLLLVYSLKSSIL